MKPLVIDLFCGLGGWSEGFLAEGYECRGYDIEAHRYPKRRLPESDDGVKIMSKGVDFNNKGDSKTRSFNYANECAVRDAPLVEGEWEEYPGTLILRDVRSITGAECKDAAVIVASPPCQAYSYRAMPWKRAKALPPPDNTLFNECFRIQREASEAAGRYIPLIVENVRGAQKWVGRARWNYGSFYLWDDVPALMPMTLKRGVEPRMKTHQSEQWNVNRKNYTGTQGWRDDGSKVAGFRFDGSGKSFQSASVQATGLKGIPHRTKGHWTNPAEHEGVKRGITIGGTYAERKERGDTLITTGSKSNARKRASAMIAKIPFPLAQHIARVFKPIE